MPLLPETIKYNDKLFRQVGLKFADCEVYKYRDERILVEPDGNIFQHYTMQDNQIKGF